MRPHRRSRIVDRMVGRGMMVWHTSTQLFNVNRLIQTYSGYALTSAFCHFFFLLFYFRGFFLSVWAIVLYSGSSEDGILG